MLNPRLMLALLAGKSLIFLTRRFGHGGTSLPGSISRKIQPSLLKNLAGQIRRGALVVTGTNGKTTTSKMLSCILEEAGLNITHNRAGANMIGGITTAFVQAASFSGRLKSDIGLIEVDEATVPLLLKDLTPRVVVVTNFFRDQLDRYGELDKTVSLVGQSLKSLPPSSTAILNADDPFVASLGQGLRCKVIYYGIEDRSYGSATMSQSAESRFCRLCGNSLNYQWYFFGQLGHYRCGKCSFSRPEPQIKVTQASLNGSEAVMKISLEPSSKPLDIKITIPGFYNVYNGLAAIAGATACKAEPKAITAGLSQFRTSFGRMEPLDLGMGRTGFLALIKNPTGCDEVVRTIIQNPGAKRLLVIINDNAADGRDISWLWDADFEALTSSETKLTGVMTSGLRGEDMALRLNYAGIASEAIILEKDIPTALQRAIESTQAEETLYIMPTYTSLLAAKSTLAKLGYSANYWEE